MDKIEIVELKESIFKNNDERAKILRDELLKKGVLLVNVMSSPGSGKTTTLVRTINELKNKYSFGVMEADIDGDCDAYTIQEKTGAKVNQLHTGGMCHLDSDMTRQGLDSLGINNLDCVFLENIGNLVCPAEFDTGAMLNVEILSIPEGDDKPLKYPLMFSVCDVVLINKIDTKAVFDFDIQKCEENIKKLNKDTIVIPISSKTGEGFENWIKYLDEQIRKIKK